MAYEEKRDASHIEKAHDIPTAGSKTGSDVEDRSHGTEIDVNRDIDHGFDPALVKRTLRKVDFRLIPVLSALYCISLIDRTNLSQARQANQAQMDRDLGWDKGNGYSLATLMFFVPYIILEVPSQLGLRKFGARWWLGISCIIWGIVMMCMGFVQTSPALIGLRALLGVFEATLFPGAAFLIACWYPRRSMALRTAIFYLLSICIGGLSATLAYGLSQLQGKAGYSGWRWIFIVTGLLTVAVGSIAILFIVDFPDKATFLTPEERHVVVTRIERDRGDSEYDPMTLAKVGTYLVTPKIWLFGYFFFTTTLATYSLAFFLPRILAGMGFNNLKAQLLYCPPYLYAPIPAISTAILADKYHQRAAAISINAVLVIVGTCLYTQVHNLGVRYFGIFLAVGSANSNVPLIVSWSQTSIRSQSKRGFTSALVIAMGGLGGIIASVAFKNEEAPKYPTGIYLTLATHALMVILAVSLKFWMHMKNRKADRGECVIEGSEKFRYQA